MYTTYNMYFILRNSVYMMASLYKVICVQKLVKNSEIDDRMVSEIIQWYVTSLFMSSDIEIGIVRLLSRYISALHPVPSFVF